MQSIKFFAAICLAYKWTHSHLVVSFNALKKIFCQKLFFELFCFYALSSHCCNFCKVPKETMSSLDQSGWKLSPETFMQAICFLCLVFSVHLVSYVSRGQSKTGLIFSRMFHFREYTKVLIFLFVNIISCCYWVFFFGNNRAIIFHNYWLSHLPTKVFDQWLILIRSKYASVSINDWLKPLTTS